MINTSKTSVKLVEDEDENDNSSFSLEIKEIILYLNTKTGKDFKLTTPKTADLIKARFNNGFTVDDFKKVIDTKSAEWNNSKDNNKFLRPETLFGTKFEGYLNQQINTSNKFTFLKNRKDH